ncbi:hypothetical protein BGZ98_003936, partial [Dissophora globulifera]
MASYDADDRPTELIPVDDDQSSTTSIVQPPIMSAQNMVAMLRSSASPPAPASTAPSPAMSFANISYLLPASPGTSDPDSRPSEMPVYESPRPPEPPKKSDPPPVIQPSFVQQPVVQQPFVQQPASQPPVIPQPVAKTPLTPMPSSGPMFQPSTTFQPSSTFKPSTTYTPTKKDTPKAPVTPRPSSTGSTFDPSVKVEVSDLKPPSQLGHFNNDSNIKVAIDDVPAKHPALARQQSDASLDSPISLDGLME